MNRISWIALGLLLAASPAAAQPRDKTAIKAVLADWQARQKAVKTVRYVLSGTSEYLKPLSPDSPQPPANDRTRPYRATMLFDFERFRHRIEVQQFSPAAGGGFRDRSSTITFDGTDSRQYNPRELAVGGAFDLLISKATPAGERAAQFDNLHWPILFGHGFIPTVQEPADSERLPSRWDADDFIDRGKHQLRGALCSVYRTEPLNGPRGIADEFWVKTDQRSAIRRYVHLSGGEPWLRLDVEWADSPIGWMPKGWTWALTAGGSGVSRLYQIKVDRMDVNPVVTDVDFTVPAVPGMETVIVGENPPPGVKVHPGYPGCRVYRIAADGEWIEYGSQGWVSLDGKTVYPLPSRWGWWPWVVGVVGVLGGGWLVYRRRRRRISTATPLASEGLS